MDLSNLIFECQTRKMATIPKEVIKSLDIMSAKAKQNVKDEEGGAGSNDENWLSKASDGLIKRSFGQDGCYNFQGHDSDKEGQR